MSKYIYAHKHIVDAPSYLQLPGGLLEIQQRDRFDVNMVGE